MYYPYNYFHDLQTFSVTLKERRDGQYWHMIQLLSRQGRKGKIEAASHRNCVASTSITISFLIQHICNSLLFLTYSINSHCLFQYPFKACFKPHTKEVQNVWAIPRLRAHSHNVVSDLHFPGLGKALKSDLPKCSTTFLCVLLNRAVPLSR